MIIKNELDSKYFVGRVLDVSVEPNEDRAIEIVGAFHRMGDAERFSVEDESYFVFEDRPGVTWTVGDRVPLNLPIPMDYPKEKLLPQDFPPSNESPIAHNNRFLVVSPEGPALGETRLGQVLAVFSSREKAQEFAEKRYDVAAYAKSDDFVVGTGDTISYPEKKITLQKSNDRERADQELEQLKDALLPAAPKPDLRLVHSQDDPQKQAEHNANLRLIHRQEQ